LSLEALPAHDELLAGDALTKLTLNHEWRRFISVAISAYLANFATDDITLDNQDLLDLLLDDLYTVDAGEVKTTSKGVDLTSNKTTTSTSYVAVANSSFNHTFSKPNALIRCSDMVVSNSGSGSVTLQLVLAGLSPEAVQEARMDSGTQRVLSTSQVYAAIPAGSRAISLQWKVSTGTGTLVDNPDLHYEIIEYDD